MSRGPGLGGGCWDRCCAAWLGNCPDRSARRRDSSCARAHLGLAAAGSGPAVAFQPFSPSPARAAGLGFEDRSGWVRGLGEMSGWLHLQICTCRFSLSSALWYLSLHLLISGELFPGPFISLDPHISLDGEQSWCWRLHFTDDTHQSCRVERGRAKAGSEIAQGCGISCLRVPSVLCVS